MRYLCLLLALASAQGRTVGSIHVEGNSRLSAAAVIGASGLKPGGEASQADLEAACTRLVDSGFFVAANYRYVPTHDREKPAIDVTLVVAESTDLKPARVQIPGVEEDAVWVWLEHNEPLVTRRLPATEAAEATYIRAIERFMAERLGRKEKVIVKLVNPTGTREVNYVFRPEVLPKVAALRFEGVHALPVADLEKALGKVALGSEYTEQDFREWLTYNLPPLYDNVGHLRVAFPRVSVEPNASGGLTVTTAIEEGAVYRLGAFELAGDDLPPGLEKLVELKPGDVVNWQTVVTGERAIASSLRNSGFLDAATHLGRTLDDQSRLAHVTLTLHKGTQFRMGELRISGLDPQSEARNRKRWPLPPGAPLDLGAVHGFRWQLSPGSAIPKISFRLERHADSDVVDLVYSFQ